MAVELLEGATFNAPLTRGVALRLRTLPVNNAVEAPELDSLARES